MTCAAWALASLPGTAREAACPDRTEQSDAPMFKLAETLATAGLPFRPKKREKDGDCRVKYRMPDPKCTPGAVMTVDLDTICHQPAGVRWNVAPSLQKKAFSDYGVLGSRGQEELEVDHLIPLELGGENTIENLWPQASKPPPGFHEKNYVEAFLHDKVCAGEMRLGDAQRQVAADWLSVWMKISRGFWRRRSGAPMSAPPSRRVVELILLFVVGPVLLALGPRWMVTAGILGIACLCGVALLMDSTFARGDLLGMAGARRGLPTVLVRTVSLGIVLVAVVAVVSRRPLLPRVRPVLWGIVMLVYPVSAYAQEVVCRTFFFHRYGALFRRPAARVLASGLVFGWAHVAVNNLTAVLLATAAGFVFASTYERWRSTLLVSVEHALYGDFAFTAGLGSLFYSSVRWMKLLGR